MLRRILLLIVVMAVIADSTYAALGSAIMGFEGEQLFFVPLLLPIGIFLGVLIARPVPRSYTERGQSRRWRNLTRERWMAVPSQDYRRTWTPVTWGSSNWLTRAEGKKIINVYL
ncbi:MAG: hypothetical protein P4L66_15300 [Acetobacteraceae bacterium]|nr:hypothetical protein [Acetobacteraceae bacterium]